MDIVNRARNIMVHPGTEWAIIDREPASAGDLYAKYLVPLGLIGPIAGLIGLTVIGVSIPFIGTYRAPFLSGLGSAIISFAALLVGVPAWAFIINTLAPTFGGRKSFLAALKVAVFAATPALLAGILSLLPALGMLQLVAALYGLYLLYLGLPVLMKAPRERALGYTAVTILSGIAIGIVLGVLMTALHFTSLSNRAQIGHASDAAVAQGALAGVLGAAAGGSDESKAAAQQVASNLVAAAHEAQAATNNAAANATPEARSSTSSVAEKQAGAAAAAGIAAIGALVGGGKPHVATVDFHTLKALLPNAVGTLARSNAQAQMTDTAGLAVSTAEASYGTAESGRLTVKITDMGNASGVLALGKLAFSTQSESDTGFEKNVVLAGRQVHEKWTATGKISELTAFIHDRFLIEVNGDGLEMPDAERAITTLDLDRLASLTG